jgi:CheY-like chemotaxis protein
VPDRLLQVSVGSIAATALASSIGQVLSEEKTETVLIVEDEPLIRMDIADQLRNDGYFVIEAGNADEAISVLEARNDIRLVFTDVDMPGSMDGLKLAAYVRDRWPPIKLIITSGHVQVEEHMVPSGGRFFPKPYEPRRIAHAIAELIRAATSVFGSSLGIALDWPCLQCSPYHVSRVG